MATQLEEIWESFEWLLLDDLRNRDSLRFKHRVAVMRAEMVTVRAAKNHRIDSFISENLKKIESAAKADSKKGIA